MKILFLFILANYVIGYKVNEYKLLNTIYEFKKVKINIKVF